MCVMLLLQKFEAEKMLISRCSNPSRDNVQSSGTVLSENGFRAITIAQFIVFSITKQMEMMRGMGENSGSKRKILLYCISEDQLASHDRHSL